MNKIEGLKLRIWNNMRDLYEYHIDKECDHEQRLQKVQNDVSELLQKFVIDINYEKCKQDEQDRQDVQRYRLLRTWDIGLGLKDAPTWTTGADMDTILDRVLKKRYHDSKTCSIEE